MKDPQQRIRVLEDEVAHLKAVIEHISEAVYLPKTTLPAVKRAVGRILVALADWKKPKQ